MAVGIEIGLRNITEDLTPQLGGSLDVNGQSIVSTSNGNVVIAPDGSGVVVITDAYLQMGDDDLLQFGDDQDYTVQWDGTNSVHTIVAGTHTFMGGHFGIGGVPTATFHVFHTGIGMKFERDSGGASTIDLINTAETYRFGLAANESFVVQDMTAAGDPLRLEILKVTGHIKIPGDAQELQFGAAQDYTIDWDGSNASHIITAGLIAFGDGGTTNYAAFGPNGDQTFVGSAGFYPRRISQADAPANGTGSTQIDSGELVVWHDSDGTDVWLVFNDATGGVVKIQLT